MEKDVKDFEVFCFFIYSGVLEEGIEGWLILFFDVDFCKRGIRLKIFDFL